MLQITEINIYTVDKSEDLWTIEGEVVFEEALTAEFAANYIPEDDEFEELSLELDIDDTYNLPSLKERILQAVEEFED